MKALWPRYTLLPIAPFALWVVWCVLWGRLRWDHLAVFLVAVGTAYTNRATRRLYFGLLPVGLVGLLYDSMRLVANVGLSERTVHVCDLRALELSWFGVTVGGNRVTLHDWAQVHSTPLLDVIFAIPYGIFLFAVVVFLVFLYIRRYPAALRYAWGFFALNVLGFATYHIYPAAPPWYFHRYGCLVDLNAHASPGPNLLRVDQMLGISYFTAFYGRSSDVFGAVPSLHVAYPLLMIFEGWYEIKYAGRAGLAAFYLWMCAAAVYLDHHWVVDIALGSLYTVCIAVAMRRLAWFRTPG
jgi:hypothetical protein